MSLMMKPVDMVFAKLSNLTFCVWRTLNQEHAQVTEGTKRQFWTELQSEHIDFNEV